MRLTSKGRYAVRAILDLTFNSNGRPVRLQEISERQKISLHYLEQLFRRLRKGSVVRSVRGPGGGYLLSRNSDEISVKDILTSVGETINPARDLTGEVDENSDTVEFHLTRTYFENLGNVMQEYLATASVGDLVRRARTDRQFSRQTGMQANVAASSPAYAGATAGQMMNGSPAGGSVNRSALGSASSSAVKSDSVIRDRNGSKLDNDLSDDEMNMDAVMDARKPVVKSEISS